MKQKLFTRNFTLLVLGQTSSLFGNFILKFALSMYVLELTGSATVFATILAVATVPTILLSPFGGILADRANRRNIMVALDTLTGLSVLGAVLLLSGGNAIAVIAALLVVLSVLGAFETPTVQACVPQMLSGDNIVRGNATINQIAAISALVAPLLGSALYVAFGIRPVMLASIVCFLLTASFECFIRLDYTPCDNSEGFIAIVKGDFKASMHFICKEQSGILKILLLASVLSALVMGVGVVGLPYTIRIVLGLGAGYFGAAESITGIAAIAGGIAAGLLIGKLKMHRLNLISMAVGAFLIPAGVIFIFPVGAITQYVVNVAAFCGVQLTVSIFSIFAVSYIQQKTPNHLIGKVMAYTSTISICMQPMGQAIYGVLFDRFSSSVELILIPTGIIICIIGIMTTGFFRRLGAEQTDCDSLPTPN